MGGLSGFNGNATTTGAGARGMALQFALQKQMKQ
jgi:hypothetical protein